jgi:hypothetical protein|tara:strand:+ start:31 stop:513 length:483 start_codon:yes stop_codon:yes gene_type:complete
MSSKTGKASVPPQESGPILSEVLPKSGLVFSEKGCLTYVLCKPKIMPIKSVTLQKLEEMEKKAAELGRVDIDEHTVNQVESAAASNLEKIKRKANKVEGKSNSVSFGSSSSSSLSESETFEASEGKASSSSLAGLPSLAGQTVASEGKSAGDNADVWKAE